MIIRIWVFLFHKSELCKNFKVEFFCFFPNNFQRNFFIKFKTISIFWWTFFWFDHFIISFFVARYLTVSLRGPVLAHYDEADRPSCDGLTGWRVDGWTGGRVDGQQKGPLIFFILRYIKHYTHIYLYTKEKLSWQISCGFKILVKLGVRMQKFKNTLLVGFF